MNGPLLELERSVNGVQHVVQRELDLGLGRVEVQGASGGGMVTVTMTAKGELKGVGIDPSLLTPSDKEMVEDLIIAAFADAKTKADRAAAEKMQTLTEGLPLPPGMKLPF